MGLLCLGPPSLQATRQRKADRRALRAALANWLPAARMPKNGHVQPSCLEGLAGRRRRNSHTTAVKSRRTKKAGRNSGRTFRTNGHGNTRANTGAIDATVSVLSGTHRAEMRPRKCCRCHGVCPQRHSPSGDTPTNALPMPRCLSSVALTERKHAANNQKCERAQCERAQRERALRNSQGERPAAPAQSRVKQSGRLALRTRGKSRCQCHGPCP